MIAAQAGTDGSSRQVGEPAGMVARVATVANTGPPFDGARAVLDARCRPRRRLRSTSLRIRTPPNGFQQRL